LVEKEEPDLTSDEWKELNKCPGYYISINGELYSKNGRYGKCGYIKPRINKKTKRYEVSLFDKKHKKHKETISRLVAKAFIPNPDNLPVVRHLDDNPDNNHVSNLAWGTQKDNMQDAIKNKTFRFFTKEDTRNANLVRMRSVKSYNIKTKEIIEYESEAEASRNTGIDQSEISTSVLSNPHCVRGNYAFCYIEDDINDKNIVDHRKFRNILATHIETNETMKFVGQSEAAKELNMSISAVSMCLSGKMKSSKGWKFEYIDKGEYDMPINKFPEYDYIPGPENKGRGRNMFRGIDLGFGGYVYAVPGIYENVALLDVQNMHGASIENLNLFGKYTQNYANLRKVRNCIKAGDFETPKSMFDGKLIPYLQNKEQAESLSAALKLPCNQTYGLTQTSYSNPAKDERNVNNTVALRGAIVMKMLQDELEEKGFPVCHIKTDSCKVPGATPEIIKFIQDYMLKFGYIMEHECTYKKMCLVNDAVYIAKYDDKGIRNKHGKHANEWTATGTQFAVPYVFKTLFSHEPITFNDFCETKSVTDGALYLDMNEDLPDVSFYEKCKETKGKIERGVKVTQKAVKELEELGDITDEELDSEIAKGHNYQFIGKVDSFVPVLEGTGGGILLRYDKDKYQAPSGTKGYRWQEAEVLKKLNKEDCIDKSYHRTLVDEAVDSISQYGDFEWFVS
jgi:hypothetical protein